MSSHEASYCEIAALQKDGARARAIAQGLARLDDMDWTDWELDFLHSIAGRQQGQHGLTTRQGEKLVELCDEAVWYTAVDGFSLAALIDRCHLLRDELSDGDAEFIARLKAGQATRLRRKDAGRLLRCARRVGEIEPHQGHSLERLPEAVLEAVDAEA